MKFKKTFIFVFSTILVILGIYNFDYKTQINNERAEQVLILDYIPSQVKYIQIIKPDLKIALQKNQTGWLLQEPFQDLADNIKIEELLKTLTTEKQISVIKKAESEFKVEDLKEFGLDHPIIIFNLKNEMGHSKKISVGSIKNFEGNSYLRINSENRIILASPIWHSKSQDDIINYREKKLYRGDLAKILKLKIKSLKDEFELIHIGDKWQEANAALSLDQDKVRDLLKKISEVTINQYIFEGEPSTSFIKEKGVDSSSINLEIHTESSKWSAGLSYNSQDKALYALTERPTYLVKLDVLSWESLGNLNLDELRDRSSVLAFNLNDVQEIYYKSEEHEFDIKLEAGHWQATIIKNGMQQAGVKLDSEVVKKIIYKIHDLKISEFLERSHTKDKFDGRNMLILKSNTKKLALQLNWGPSFKVKKAEEEKYYYYVRTHLSDFVFALEKNLIDSLGFDEVISSNNKKDVTVLNDESGDTIGK